MKKLKQNTTSLDPLKSGRELTRLLNGLNGRLEAAFLLLKFCPQCGSNLKSTYKVARGRSIKKMTCPYHGVVSTRFKDELLSALDPASGIQLTQV